MFASIYPEGDPFWWQRADASQHILKYLCEQIVTQTDVYKKNFVHEPEKYVIKSKCQLFSL